MSLDFQPRPGSAVDPGTGLTLYPPRLLPASPPAAPDDTEFQYAIFRDGKRFYGLGLIGSDAWIERDGRREHVFLLDLSPVWVLDTVLELKQMLGDDGDGYAFVRGLARGLVGVFESRTDNDDDTRYLALIDPIALAERDIAVPADAPRRPGGELLLAEAFVPAHADGSVAS